MYKLDLIKHVRKTHKFVYVEKLVISYKLFNIFLLNVTTSVV